LCGPSLLEVEDPEEVEGLSVGGLSGQELLVGQAGVVELAALVERERGMQGVSRHEEDNSVLRSSRRGVPRLSAAVCGSPRLVLWERTRDGGFFRFYAGGIAGGPIHGYHPLVISRFFLALLLAACQVEYADVIHEDERDSVEPAGPTPPATIVFSRADMVEPVLDWDGLSLTEEVCAFYEGSTISGADMEDIELSGLTLQGGYAGTLSEFPRSQEVRIVGLYGSSGSYPSASNVASLSVIPAGEDGNWSASWFEDTLHGLNACAPDCYYSGFHLEMRVPWEDDQTPAVSCESFLQMELSFDWHDLSEEGGAL